MRDFQILVSTKIKNFFSTNKNKTLLVDLDRVRVVYANSLNMSQEFFCCRYQTYENFVFELFAVAVYGVSELEIIANFGVADSGEYFICFSEVKFRLAKNHCKNKGHKCTLRNFYMFNQKIRQLLQETKIRGIENVTHKSLYEYLDTVVLKEVKIIDYCPICLEYNIGKRCLYGNHLVYCDDCFRDYYKFCVGQSHMFYNFKCDFVVEKCFLCTNF